MRVTPQTIRIGAVALIAVGVATVLLVGGIGGDSSVTVESVSGDSTVTVTYTTASGESGQFTASGVDPRLSNAQRDWVIVERSSLPSALARSDGPGGDVVGFGEWALVGSMSSATVGVDGAELTVVVPDGRDVDPGRKAGFVREFAGPYTLSPDGTAGRVVVVSVPDALPSKGLMYSDDRGYVTRPSFWDGDAHSVWIHEFVHARQDFRTAPGMRWFREASAVYLSSRFMQEQYEGVTEADLRDSLEAGPAYGDAVLANRTTWRDTEANYDAGARLLAAIDAEIRAESGGDHTLVDVFRAMNTREGPITVEVFVGLVEEYTGSDQSWIEDAITGEPGSDGRYRP